MATISGDFSGVGTSDTIAVAKNGTANGTITGSWPSNSALFVMEASMDGGTTWTALPGADYGIDGVNDPGPYGDAGRFYRCVVGVSSGAMSAASKVRIRVAAFRSGWASWTLST